MRGLIIVAGLFGLALATPAAAQSTADTRINPTRGAIDRIDRSDPITAARVMSAFGQCVARNREPQARAVLAMPLRSQAQLDAVRAMRLGDCLGWSGATISFSPPLLVGAMAEFFVTQRMANADLRAIKGLTDRQIAERGLAPRTSYEDVATCLAAREPEAVMNLARSQAGSAQAGAAFRVLIPNLGPCTPAGQNHTFNHEGLRALAAVGLYRLLSAPAAPAS